MHGIKQTLNCVTLVALQKNCRVVHIVQQYVQSAVLVWKCSGGLEVAPGTVCQVLYGSDVRFAQHPFLQYNAVLQCYNAVLWKCARGAIDHHYNNWCLFAPHTRPMPHRPNPE